KPSIENSSDAALAFKNGIIQLHEPFFNFLGRIQIFEVCRHASLARSLFLTYLKRRFFAQLFSKESCIRKTSINFDLWIWSVAFNVMYKKPWVSRRMISCCWQLVAGVILC